MTATAIQIFKDYPEKQYNPLVPVQTMTQISPLHKPSINVVHISTAKEAKDTYKEKNGEYALTKKGLMKLMAAANISIIDSHSVTPSSCKKCLDMARATGKPSNCAECPCKGDTAWQVTIAIPDLSGGARPVTATREFLCEDERKKATSEKQYQMAYAFRSAIAESKALNRALREGLMIQATYPEAALSKPFAVPVISLNLDDPDMKKAAIERYARGEAMLYGGPPQEAPALSAGEAIEIPADEIEDDFDGGVNVFPVQEGEFICQDCGAPIFPIKDNRSGEEWSIERLARFGMEQFGAPLCAKCLQARKKATA